MEMTRVTVLALIFSLAYERTGNIGTPIIAHSLFNLYAAAVTIAGVSFRP